MERQKGKDNTRKNNNTTWGNKPESTGERRKKKEIPTKGKTLQAKHYIPNQAKKILPTSGKRWHENITIAGCKKIRIIFYQNMATKKT